MVSLIADSRIWSRVLCCNVQPWRAWDAGRRRQFPDDTRCLVAYKEISERGNMPLAMCRGQRSRACPESGDLGLRGEQWTPVSGNMVSCTTAAAYLGRGRRRQSLASRNPVTAGPGRWNEFPVIETFYRVVWSVVVWSGDSGE